MLFIDTYVAMYQVGHCNGCVKFVIDDLSLCTKYDSERRWYVSLFLTKYVQIFFLKLVFIYLENTVIVLNLYNSTFHPWHKNYLLDIFKK